MNDYEAKQEARKKKYEALSAKKAAQGKQTLDEAKRMASVIPFGQPILVGHHSERADRNYRKRIDGKYRKGFAALGQASHYEQKAASVGKGGVSNDDPAAIEKLADDLEKRQQLQELMKAANKIIRKKKLTDDEKITALIEDLELSRNTAENLLEPDFAGRLGFPGYKLTNNNSRIRDIKKRIEALEAQHQIASENDAPVSREYPGGITLVENHEENRVQITFPGKPGAEIRQLLKSNGFHWSLANMAWQRQLNDQGLVAARHVLGLISGSG